MRKEHVSSLDGVDCPVLLRERGKSAGFLWFSGAVWAPSALFVQLHRSLKNQPPSRHDLEHRMALAGHTYLLDYAALLVLADLTG